MGYLRSGLSRAKTMACAILLLLGGLSITACAAASPTPVRAESAEIDKTIQAQGFEVTLIDLPEKLKTVGGDIAGSDDTYDATGIFVIVPISLTNNADELRTLPGLLLKVRDDQGQEFRGEQAWHHRNYIWGDKRWMDNEHQLPQNPMDPGLTREGPLIFDVPEDATGLELIMEGTDASIALGF